MTVLDAAVPTNAEKSSIASPNPANPSIIEVAPVATVAVVLSITFPISFPLSIKIGTIL